MSPLKQPSRLRIARLVRGLRLLDVERETRIPESRLSRIERRERPLRPGDLRKLAEFYGVSPDTLVDRETGAKL